MISRLRQFSILGLAIFMLGGTAVLAQSVRIKDIASVEGVRSNQLVGYGLVVGLEGTGDSQQAIFTTHALANMLETYGITVSADKLKVKNVAAVMITADLPAFARPGSTIDVVVSSMGDSRSLQGGTLLQTPLKAANGEVYAVAQGPLTIGGFNASSGGSSVTKNHPTVGRIPGGAIVEKETTTNLTTMGMLNVVLNKNDFTTANRVANAIDTKLGRHYAMPIDGNLISVEIPEEYSVNTVALISEIEDAEVTMDSVAKVIVNERTGTVVIGGQARISPIAVSHGSLTVEVSKTPEVSQPKPISKGKTVVVQKTDIKASEEPGHLIEVNSGTTIEDLVRALNALKVTPRDLIAILQSIKEAGALQAQLEVI